MGIFRHDFDSIWTECQKNIEDLRESVLVSAKRGVAGEK
jgi:hypothetical protein